MSQTDYTLVLPAFTIGVHAYDAIGKITRHFGKKVVIIGGKTALSKAKQPLLDAIAKTDLEVLGVLWYGDDATYEHVDRLLREYKVEANVGAPQVAYKETITKAVDQDTKYARQSGGKGQYGHVKIHVEPNESGKGYEFVNALVGGAIPKEYVPAIDAGIQGAMLSGVLAGYPVVDVKVTLYDGSYHEVDSSEMAFKIAGSMAFKEACQKAGPTLLEPIMKVCVIVPDEYMGDVIGDLNSRRGQIQGFEARSGAQQIDAFVPLAEMFGYATDLRSCTQGRGQYTMEPAHYIEIPKNIQEKIINQRTNRA